MKEENETSYGRELGMGMGGELLQVFQVVKNPPAKAGNIRGAGYIPVLGKSLEYEMATHSSILAWRIPGTEEFSRLQSVGSQRVGQD